MARKTIDIMTVVDETKCLRGPLVADCGTAFNPLLVNGGKHESPQPTGVSKVVAWNKAKAKPLAKLHNKTQKFSSHELVIQMGNWM